MPLMPEIPETGIDAIFAILANDWPLNDGKTPNAGPLKPFIENAGSVDIIGICGLKLAIIFVNG